MLQVPATAAAAWQTGYGNASVLSLCCLLHSLSTSLFSSSLLLPLSLSLPRPFTALFCVLAKTTENLATCFEPHRTSSSAGGQQCHKGQGQCQRVQAEGQGGHSCLVVASGILGGCYAGRPAFKGVCNTHELAKAALPCAKSVPPSLLSPAALSLSPLGHGLRGTLRIYKSIGAHKKRAQ